MKVRLYSYIGFSTGYGRAGRELAYSLLAARVDLEIRPLGTPSDAMAAKVAPELVRCVRQESDQSKNPDAIIVHALPYECPKVLEVEGLVKCLPYERPRGHAARGPKLIAYSTWEGQSEPKSLASIFAPFDQTWMPNQLPWPTIGGSKLFAVPHSFDAAPNTVPRTRGEHEPFRFYTIGAWQARKNMGGLIRAFAHVFTPADHVELLIHSSGADKMNFGAAVATTGLHESDLPKIRLSNEQVSDEAIDRLHANSDCFVTATRGEAWHLPAYDAMLSGRHVISPKLLGSDDFLGDTSAVLYDAQLTPPMADVAARSGEKGVRFTVTYQHGLDCRQSWLEPDLDELGFYMRQAYRCSLRTLEANYDVVARFGRHAVGKLALAALEAP